MGIPVIILIIIHLLLPCLHLVDLEPLEFKSHTNRSTAFNWGSANNENIISNIDTTKINNIETHPQENIYPIKWKNFGKHTVRDQNIVLLEKILLNSARYGSQWIERTYQNSITNDRYLIPNEDKQNTIRPPCSIALGLATVIKTGLSDNDSLRISTSELIKQTTKLIKGVASIHKANGGQWGDQWQSSHWTAFLGRAGWMMWDDLDMETRWFVRRMILFEANKYIDDNYKIPYWIEQSGNSNAAVNAWNAMILQLAVAMMPEHQHVARWKEMGTRMLMASFARKSDMTRSEPLVDGKSPRDWLKGYNIKEDGTVINNGRIQIDYMTCMATLKLQGFLIFSLAERTVPQAAKYNFDLVYNAFVNNTFASPPHKNPGGTIFKFGLPDIYYPDGGQWENVRFDIFLIMDAYATVLVDNPLSVKEAEKWLELRARKILQMQSRHTAGRVYAPGEFEYASAEAMALRILADAYLLKWLEQTNKLSASENWRKGGN